MQGCGSNLTLMTVGALLGVEIFRQNAEHVVTLYAHTMESRLPRCGSFMLRGMGLCGSWLSGHGQILA